MGNVAYFAGLFDGEGTVGVEVKDGPRGGTGVLIIALGSTYFPILDELKAQFGGCLTKPRLSSPRSRKLSRDWKATNETAADFLRAVYPYLRIKKRQAALAFKFRKIMSQNLRKWDVHRADLFRDIASEIKSLNRQSFLLVETVKPAPETVKSQSSVQA